MAPKGKGKEPGGPFDEGSLAECKRLQELAYEGMLSKSRKMCTDEASPSKVLLKADGKDIVKKSSVRKGRYLLNINASIAAAAAGRMGSLAQLDSRNPVMYIDFPEGRLKFFGTLMFPSNKYMVLKFGTKDIVCEDILESMVVFSEAWWVGKKEENPSEAKLPLPQSLIEAGMEAGEAANGMGTQQTANGAARSAAKAPREPRKHAGESSDEDSNGSEEDDGENGTPAVGRRMSQRSAGKRPRYAVDVSDDEDADEDGTSTAGGSDNGDGDAEDDASDASERPLKRARGSQRAGPAARAGARQRGEPEAAAAATDDAEEEGDPEQPAATYSRKQGGKRAAGKGRASPAAAGRKSAATPKRGAARKHIALDTDSEDDGVIDLSSPKPSQSQRPVRAAAARPGKATLEDASSDEDEHAEEQEESEEDPGDQNDESFSL